MISIPNMDLGGVTFNSTMDKWTTEQRVVYGKVYGDIIKKQRNLEFVITVSKVRAVIETLSPSSRDLVLQHIISILETYELLDANIHVPSGINSFNSTVLLQWFKGLMEYYANPSGKNFSAKWNELCYYFSVSPVFSEIAKSVLV